MFWRSIVGKLAVTILLLVSLVLFILTFLLLSYFESFHLDQAKRAMRQTATEIAVMVDQYDDEIFMKETIERIKDPESRVAVVYRNGTIDISDTEEKELVELGFEWFNEKADLQDALRNNSDIEKQVVLPNSEIQAMMVGIPLEDNIGVVYVYQSIDYINQTKAETTKIIFLAAGTAILLTTILAFFLSTRITAPLIELREAALDLTRGQFDTKVPILSYDEIGELGLAFNRMGRQLKFHVHALNQEKEQLSGIVNSMADGIITLNKSGKMLLANPPAKRFISDWNYEHMGDTNVEEDILPAQLHDMLEYILEGKHVHREFKIQGRYWDVIMTPLYDLESVRGAVAVIRDMTEERKLDKLRKDFIANVSHELRTPIALMQGYSEAIVDDIAETIEDKNELAEIIHDESLRMGRLVNELLDLARMESGQIQLNITEVQVPEFIRKIIKKFSGSAEQLGIELKMNVIYEVTDSRFDEDRMEQVLTNLIDNAISHTKEKGVVTVAVHNSLDVLFLEVEDTGEGIPEEDIPFIFERFYKADKSRARSTAEKGTGLGLSIAKNIIKAHNGKLYVKSKMGVGTIFSIEIPYQLTQEEMK